MKRILTCALAFLLCLTLLAGCQPKEDEKLICGVTIFEPMNYKDGDQWTGFDTDFAKLVGEKLNMTVEFQEIKWDSRYSELESGAINCIWNGFTANSTDSDGTKRSDKVDFSYSYMLNQQCIVIKADRVSEFPDMAALLGKSAAAEQGSAGEAQAAEAVGDGGNVVGTAAQTNTFTEVKSGAVDFAVVDILLAQKTVGNGDFADLAIADITMDSEVYAIGFKKGSELTAKVNEAIKALDEEGKLAELAQTYNLENSYKLDTNFNG